MFNQLLQIAKENLTTLNETVVGLPAPQVTVLLTANDTLYVTANDADGRICETMVENQDTQIVCMVTMWKDGGVDLSSHHFRVALVEMDRRNTDTAIILQGETGLHTKTLNTTISPIDQLRFAETGEKPMNTTKGRWVFLILSALIPFFYISMYLPIWNGKELLLADLDTPGILLLSFQHVYLIWAMLRLCFAKMRNRDAHWLSLVSPFLFIASLVVTLFVGYFFVLELCNVPWFPAQS